MLVRRYIPMLILTLVIFLMTGTVLAAETGQIKGTISEYKTHNPIEGAVAFLVGTRMGAKADANGEFLIKDVPAGVYSLRFNCIGFNNLTISKVEVIAGKTVQIDTMMYRYYDGCSGPINVPSPDEKRGVGRIEGKVFDSTSGKPIGGTSVQIEGTTMGAKTNFDGEYSIINVPPGNYQLVFEASGYEKRVVPAVEIQLGVMTRINLRLQQTAIETGRVDKVTGTRKKTDFNQTGTVETKTMDQIKRAPVSSVDEILSQETGITHNSEVESIRHAGRSSKTRYENDGVVYYDPVGRRAPVAAPKPVTREERQDDRGYNMEPSGRRAYPPRQPREYEEYLPPRCFPPDNFNAMYFQDYGVNPFVVTRNDYQSTFAIDVDDASFGVTRAYLERDALPPVDAVRVEEFINHFDYDYAAPREEPFAVYVDGAPSPYDETCDILRIGIKGREVSPQERKPANLIFVIDVSGSMRTGNRLEMVKDALGYLVDRLYRDDYVGIVAYSSTAWVVLEPTPAVQRRTIMDAVNQLYPTNNTNAEAGLRLGYEMADRWRERGLINRVILCSDGVANTGRTDPDELVRQIKRYADRGVTLTAIGVGMGNYNDILLEKLADNGNGNYYYINDNKDARKVFTENLEGVLQEIARDVKIQVEFDPETVDSYRLIGYENRDVADRDFRNDRVDGGEIGAGHEVTALYEIRLNRRVSRRQDVLGQVYIRFKDPDTFRAREISFKIGTRDLASGYGGISSDLKMAIAACQFGEIMRASYWARGSSLSDAHRLAREVYLQTRQEQARELLDLISRAIRLGARADR